MLRTCFFTKRLKMSIKSFIFGIPWACSRNSTAKKYKLVAVDLFIKAGFTLCNVKSLQYFSFRRIWWRSGECGPSKFVDEVRFSIFCLQMVRWFRRSRWVVVFSKPEMLAPFRLTDVVFTTGAKSVVDYWASVSDLVFQRETRSDLCCLLNNHKPHRWAQ